MSIKEAAQFVGVSEDSLRNAIERGHIPVVHGEIRRVLIPRKALQLYLAGRLAFRIKGNIVPIEPLPPERGAVTKRSRNRDAR